MLDALPAHGRAAAIATVWALMTDDLAGDVACESAHALGDPWRLTHDEGTADTDVQAAGAGLLDAGTTSIRSSDSRVADAVTAWSERPRTAPPEDLATWLLDAAEPMA